MADVRRAGILRGAKALPSSTDGGLESWRVGYVLVAVGDDRIGVGGDCSVSRVGLRARRMSNVFAAVHVMLTKMVARTQASPTSSERTLQFRVLYSQLRGYFVHGYPPPMSV